MFVSNKARLSKSFLFQVTWRCTWFPKATLSCTCVYVTVLSIDLALRDAWLGRWVDSMNEKACEIGIKTHFMVLRNT